MFAIFMMTVAGLAIGSLIGEVVKLVKVMRK
jgi:hypothetical protein